MKTYYVYTMASKSRTLYVGVTNNLMRRVYEHKNKLIPGFTSRYNITMLVYYAETNDVREALGGEKRIKGWLRSKKKALIEEMNPTWADLSADWYDEVTDNSGQNLDERDPSLRLVLYQHNLSHLISSRMLEIKCER